MPLELNEIVSIFKRIHLFRGIDEPRLEAAAAIIKQVEYPASSSIFKQGDDADYFYFVASGRVRVLRHNEREQQDVQLGYLEEDDYFGEELLEASWPRQITTDTVTDVTLLRLDVPDFVQILQIMPELTGRLELILNSYRLMLSTHFVWQDPEETIYFIARRHPLFLWTQILQPILFGAVIVPIMLFLNAATAMSMTTIILLVLALLVTLVWLVWNYVDWSNDYYIVTNQRVIYQERIVLLYDSRQESPLEAVQSTSINTTQIGRWLGYGNVAIRTYIGTILFRSVASPEQVMGLIQEQQARSARSARRLELRNIESTIKGRIGLAPPDTSKPKAPAPEKITPLRRFLSDIAHLRYEIGGTILYRTHWFILLKKIWIPSLLLLGFAALFLLSVMGQFTLLSLQATCALTIMVGGVISLWWLYQFFDWHNDVYLITPDQIVDVNKRPLGREFRQAAPLKNILSIEYKRLGILGLILNFGTVYIRVGDQQLTFDNVFNPAEVQRELFHRLSAKNYAEKQAAVAGDRQRIADWIATYHRVVQNNPPPQTPQPPARPGF